MAPKLTVADLHAIRGPPPPFDGFGTSSSVLAAESSDDVFTSGPPALITSSSDPGTLGGMANSDDDDIVMSNGGVAVNDSKSEGDVRDIDDSISAIIMKSSPPNVPVQPETKVQRDPFATPQKLPEVTAPAAPAAPVRARTTPAIRPLDVQQTPLRKQTVIPSAPSNPSLRHLFNLQQLNQAQINFPATGALFVGNLPNALSDEILDQNLFRHFEQFGNVFVAVRRTVKKKLNGEVVVAPWAIVQYEHQHHAATALQASQGMSFGGRFLRLEWSTSRRGLYVWRTNLAPPTYSEIRCIMAAYGNIDHVAINVRITQPNGSWVIGAAVQFCNYGSYILAKRNFRSLDYGIA